MEALAERNLDIDKLRKSGLKIREIQKIHNISRARISEIINRSKGFEICGGKGRTKNSENRIREIEEINVLRKECKLPLLVPKEMPCLRCSKPMITYQASNRLCDKCRRYMKHEEACDEAEYSISRS